MGPLFAIALVFYFAYHTYSRARRKGESFWPHFFLLAGAMVAFFVAFFLPGMQSKAGYAKPGYGHPMMVFATVFGGFVFTVGVIVYIFCKRPGSAATTRSNAPEA